MTETPLLPAWLDRASYPFRTRYARVPEGRIHLVDEGSGPHVLLSHGTPTWSYEYRHLIRALRGTHRMIAPDHLGFGLSDRPADADYSPEAHARRFAALANALDLRDVTLVVHDFGGPIALPWALAHPERVARIVYLNTFVAPFEDETMRSRARLAGSWLGRLLYRFANLSLRVILPAAYGDRRKLTPAIHAHYLRVFPEGSGRVRVLHALARALLGSEAHYAGLAARAGELAAVPSWILWGLADPAFPPAQLERLKALLPSAEVHTITHAGHWPHEEAPEIVAELLNLCTKS